MNSPSADSPTRPDAPPPRRIALYSHDTQGLGHVRRNLLIARALAGPTTSPAILMLSGVREAAAFAMPDGVDCLTLPSLAKNDAGAYEPRTLTVPMTELIALRTGTISAAIESFQPHVLVVDKVPLGAFGELQPTLVRLRERVGTRTVLGLREILDAPHVIRREWNEQNFEKAVLKYYDQIWVYGDQTIFDPVTEYGMHPAIADRVRHTGYLDPHALAGDASGDARALDGLHLPNEPFALCVVGGGRDGVDLGRAFLEAPRPAGLASVLVTGPRMPDDAVDQLRMIAEGDRNLHVRHFVTDPTPLMRQATMIVAMGGYNTLCEIVSLRKPALIVPRIAPRTEQLIRARRLAGLGLVDLLQPESLSPISIGAWLHRTDTQPAEREGLIDMQGLDRLARLMEELLTEDSPERERIHAVG